MENQYRNSFHIEPAQGLLNDPNGLIQFKGKYYFFHQWNRFDTNHDYKEWGLFVSDDLVHWESVGSALLPDCFDDKNGVYSGSAIEHEEQLYLFYTGNSKIDGQRKSTQKIARSDDGRTFIKQTQTIETPEAFTEHFRDPKVWKQGNQWQMIVGGQTKENNGAIALYQSKDLLNWNYVGIFYEDTLLDQMCECPDFFSLTEDIALLTVCPQKRTSTEKDEALSSYAGYLSGHLDDSTNTFIPSNGLKKLDQGFDFYAPQTFEDNQGRRLMVGWMSRMEEAEELHCPTLQDGYLHCLTMPRELKWQENQLYQVPLKEYQNLRKSEEVYSASSGDIENQDKAYEIIVDFKEAVSEFSLSMNSGANTLHYQDNQLVVSRINWVTQETEVKQIDLHDLTKLQIFCDTSAIEIFVNDGQKVFSMRFFSTNPRRDAYYENLNENGSILFYTY